MVKKMATVYKAKGISTSNLISTAAGVPHFLTDLSSIGSKAASPSLRLGDAVESASSFESDHRLEICLDPSISLLEAVPLVPSVMVLDGAVVP